MPRLSVAYFSNNEMAPPDPDDDSCVLVVMVANPDNERTLFRKQIPG